MVLVLPAEVRACTIVVLTDQRGTLFCNNEDWSDPEARLWFIPAGKDYLGCAYIGFQEGWAQGGVNSAGLAFDWVAGFAERWEVTPQKKTARGNPAQRMLETCRTVDEAIAYFQAVNEPSFATARILIADRTGASVILGAKNGQLQVERSNRSRGFGYAGSTAEARLAFTPKSTMEEGTAILDACVQTGKYATKYSSVYDLTNGTIFVRSRTANGQGELTLNLETELSKGGHLYSLATGAGEKAVSPEALPNQFKRFFLDEWPPIEDRDPQVIRRIESMLLAALHGSLNETFFTADLWAKLAPQQDNLRTDLERLGSLVTVRVVERKEEGEVRIFRYRVDFANAAVLQVFKLDPAGKISSLASESVELKPVAPIRER